MPKVNFIQPDGMWPAFAMTVRPINNQLPTVVLQYREREWRWDSRH
jgi:hypothetical protein